MICSEIIRHVQVNVRKTCHLTLASTSSSKTNVKKYLIRHSSSYERLLLVRFSLYPPLSSQEIHFKRKKVFLCLPYNLKLNLKIHLEYLKRSQKVFLLLWINVFAQKWTFYDAKGYCYCLVAIILLFTFLFVSNWY